VASGRQHKLEVIASGAAEDNNGSFSERVTQCELLHTSRMLAGATLGERADAPPVQEMFNRGKRCRWM